MNLCTIDGTIESNIQFDFFYNSKKHQSVVSFEINTIEKNNGLSVKAYDEIADTIYREYDKGNYIIFTGKIREQYIEITEIYKWFCILNGYIIEFFNFLFSKLSFLKILMEKYYLNL